MSLPDSSLPARLRPGRPLSAAVREVAHRVLRCGALLLLLATAAAQDDPVARMVANDAQRWIGHRDPVVRGEAALILASLRASEHHDAILTVARDDRRAARLRGLLALGLQATPGVAFILDEILSNQRERTSSAGICAAFALGALPPDHAPTVVSRTLSSFCEANWKRQGPVLAALLHGLERHSARGQLVALRRLHAVRANRDPALRSRVLRLVLRADDEVTGEEVLDLLENASDEERLVTLRWLEGDAFSFEDRIAPAVVRLARSAPRADVRAAALDVLTRLRHPSVLELSARALRSRDALEVEAGVRSLMLLGGSAARVDLEHQLLAAKDPARITGMLRAWSSPPSGALTDHWMALAADERLPLDARTGAVVHLARSDPARAAPLLRGVFQAARTTRHLTELSRALVARDVPRTDLDRLLPEADVMLAPEHWQALVAAGHPGATRQLLEVLEDPAPSTERLRTALVLWRVPMVTRTVDAADDTLPEPLRSLLLGAVK